MPVLSPAAVLSSVVTLSCVTTSTEGSAANKQLIVEEKVTAARTATLSVRILRTINLPRRKGTLVPSRSPAVNNPGPFALGRSKRRVDKFIVFRLQLLN